jgi:NAD(P)-dependent dehydrogenase (short-subunit alcohol dehydrogenase family)
MLDGVDLPLSMISVTPAEMKLMVDAFTEADWDTAYAFNVKQSLWLAQAAKPIFNANEKGGHLIITSSVAGTRASGSSIVCQC